jgi:hypothetical protein
VFLATPARKSSNRVPSSPLILSPSIPNYWNRGLLHFWGRPGNVDLQRFFAAFCSGRILFRWFIMSKIRSFRVGRVTVHQRGRTWYLRYRENARRHQVRAGTDKDSSRRLAAQVNAQLESGAPAACSFEQISIPELRERWLDHHEHVLRSSVTTTDFTPPCPRSLWHRPRH